jgi:uncharacterized membrane protein HdeD (DUF308 family)
MLILRGVFAVLFGIMSLVWPHLTVVTLVILFGAYSLADGIFALFAAMQKRGQWWMLLLEGIAGIAAGIFAFARPGLTALALLYLIAAWAVVTGVLELIEAVKLRTMIEGEVFLTLAGIASIAFGVLLMMRPAAGALALVWLIGGYALVFGVLMIGLGIHMRSSKEAPATRPTGKQDEQPKPPSGVFAEAGRHP